MRPRSRPLAEAQALSRPKHKRIKDKKGLPLSPRELQVFGAYCAYGSRDKAAVALGISLSTVRNHMSSIYRKLDVPGSGDVLTAATRLGWLKVPEAFYPPDIPLEIYEQQSVEGVILGFRDAVTAYAAQHLERVVAANEAAIYRTARKRATERLEEEFRPPPIVGRVRRTA